MTTEEATETAALQPFVSLRDLQQEHLALRREVEASEPTSSRAAPSDEASSRRDVVLLRHRIRRFEQRAAAAGSILDERSDRDLVQSLLDYWSIRQAYLLGQAERLRAEQMREGGKETGPRETSALPEAFTLAPFDEMAAPTLDDAQSPFIGLSAFTELDASRALFQGRNEAVSELVQSVAANRLLLVTGSSGSGKSSLVMAGLIPALRAGALPGSAEWTYWPPVLPGPDPFAALLGAVRPAGQELAAWVDKHRAALERTPSRFPEIVAEAGGAAPSLLVVDQMEELLTMAPAGNLRESFASAILALASVPEPAHRVMIVVREDFLGRLEKLKPIVDLPKDMIALYRPKPMTAGELRLAIDEPARAVGVKFDPGIIDELVQEVAGDPAALPLLQFTLTQLWRRRRRNRITREAYLAVGRPAEALERTAEETFVNLRTLQAQDAAREIFLTLVVPAFALNPAAIPGGDADQQVIGSEWVRRRVRRDVLHQLRDLTQIDRVLDAFVKAGLVRMTPGAERGDDRFDVMHEALLRNWRRLSQWLFDKRRENERQVQVLTAARQWDQAGRHPDHLPVGEALEDAAQYTGDPLIADYVAAGRAAATRRTRYNRAALTAAAAALVGIVGLLIALLYFQSSREWYQDVDLQQKTELGELLKLDTEQSKPQAKPPSDTEVPHLMPKGPGVEGYLWVGSPDQPLLRDVKTGTVADLAQVEGKKQYRVRTDIALRSGWPGDGEYVSPPRLFDGTGEAAGGALIFIQDVKSYDRPSGQQYWVKARIIPQIFLQYPEQSRRQVAGLAKSLRQLGYDVPGPDLVSTAPDRSEIRYFNPQDKAPAEKLARDFARLPGNATGNIPVRDMSGGRGKLATGTIELWLGARP